MTLLHLPSEAAYRAHYVQAFTGRPHNFATASGTVPVYFSRDQFDHAFFESMNRNGVKDQFSKVRAERMNHITTALSDRTLERRAGWDSRRQRHDHVRCVTVTLGDFVIVIRLGMTQSEQLKGNFVTCYVADNSIGKIRRSPSWDEGQCLKTIRALKGR